MCGIHLILDKRSQLDPDPIQRMLEATSHRGPDEARFIKKSISGGQVFLGANRLMITDNSPGASQPFEKNSAVLVFNGEIYNFLDLKNDQIDNGITFRSASDTEVLCHHLNATGIDNLPKLNGMFAFIHLNAESGDIILARDEWGMKPLFYLENEEYIIASSELTSLLASGLVNKEICKEAVNAYLKYRYIPSPLTIYKNVKALSPGHGIKIEGGRLSELKWKQEVKESVPEDTDALVKIVDESIKNSLLCHLPLQHQACLLLSGGVDSTLLLAQLQELGYGQFPTYTIVPTKEFVRNSTSDQEYARMASKQFNGIYNEVPVGKILDSQIFELINHFDQPVGDIGALATYLVSEKACKHFRVSFSGAGADELFGGYNRHRAFKFYLENYALVNKFKTAGKHTASLFSKFAGNGAGLQKFFSSIHENPAVTFDDFISTSFTSSETLSSLWHSNDPGDIESQLENALKHDRENYLISDVLALSDRMSMAHSMEMRMPYLDSRLVQTVRSSKSSILLEKGPKWILKELLALKGGKKFVSRPKEGFGLPLQSWYDKHNEGLWSFMDDDNALIFRFIEKNRILELREINRQSDIRLDLWSVMLLANWLEQNF